MNELKFKEKFPELNENQIRMLQRELTALIGPEVSSDSHVTRDYNREDYARDQVNQHKRAIRSRIESYLNDRQPISHTDKQ